jgi:nucleoside-diphosphate-sugar epimerase
VRDPSNAGRTAHLTSLPGAEKNLELVKADLLDGSDVWEPAVEGCDFVLHTASPFVLAPKDPQRDLVDPAVKGTEAVLSACGTLKKKPKVVLTSSIAAIMGDKFDKGEVGHVFSDADWNETSSLAYQPYFFSKKKAEERAWALSKELGFELCTINPTFVMGPMVSKTSGTSIDFCKSMCAGKWKTGSIDDRQGIVDVRDVALAHLRAMERGVNGSRYLCSHGSGAGINYVTMGEMIAAKHPEYKDMVPRRNFGKVVMYLVGPMAAGISWWHNYNNIGLPFSYSTERIEKELGMEWTPIETTFGDMVASLKEHGILR